MHFKYICSILLIFVMTANVAVSLVRQLQNGEVYELSEMDTDDADEKNKTETETEKEKEAYTFSHHFPEGASGEVGARLNKAQYPSATDLISESYASLPDLPPEPAILGVIAPAKWLYLVFITI